MPPAARANGQATPTPTTPAAGGQRTTPDPGQREALQREALPAGSGTIDEPDESTEVEDTLEAFRQLSGEAENAPQPRELAPEPVDEFQPGPDDQGFPDPTAAPTPTEPPIEAREAPQPAPPAVEQPPAGVQPVAPAAPTVAPAPAQPETDPQTVFQEMSRQLDENLGAFQTALADRVYTISDKDLDDLQTDPKKVYAQMMARVHINAVSSVMRTVAQQMPVVVSGMLRAHAQNQAAEGRFWDSYPQLNRTDPRQRQLVGQIARTVRALNPQMTEADMVRLTGTQAVVMLGLQGQPGAVPPAQPQAAPQMPGRRVRQTPAAYQPAAARAQPAAPQAPRRNQWDVMAQLMQYDNQGVFDPSSG
jgi:hypothetical protein